LYTPDIEKTESEKLNPDYSESSPAAGGSWTDAVKITDEPIGPVAQTNPTVAARYSSTSTNDNKNRLRKYLEDRGLDADTVDALLVQAGAESGYNYQAKNPSSSAYGLG